MFNLLKFIGGQLVKCSNMFNDIIEVKIGSLLLSKECDVSILIRDTYQDARVYYNFSKQFYCDIEICSLDKDTAKEYEENAIVINV